LTILYPALSQRLPLESTIGILDVLIDGAPYEDNFYRLNLPRNPAS
jgi:hypothetical protein